MGEISTTEGDRVHRLVWELLPWRVNETLDPEEVGLVDAHCATCQACRTELETQRRLASVLSEFGDLETVEGRHWDALRDRIMDERVGEGPLQASNVAPWLAQFRKFSRSFWALPAAGVVAVCALLLFANPPLVLDAVPYQTLTSEEAMAGPVIRLKAAIGVERDEMALVFAEAGVEIVDGPSPTGVYTLQAATDTQDLEAIAALLKTHSDIEFVTVRESR
ncbi:MAG: hypothetical protein AAGF58_13405 [Pseudomonadota bacterium]